MQREQAFICMDIINKVLALETTSSGAIWNCAIVLSFPGNRRSEGMLNWLIYVNIMTVHMFTVFCDTVAISNKFTSVFFRDTRNSKWIGVAILQLIVRYRNGTFWRTSVAGYLWERVNGRSMTSYIGTVTGMMMTSLSRWGSHKEREQSWEQPLGSDKEMEQRLTVNTMLSFFSFSQFQIYRISM